MDAAIAAATATALPTTEEEMEDKNLQPYPFFYYRDFSTEKDPDPLTPLTPPGRVPTFPAKLHAILSRADLSDVIAWMPHGRSWRVLKPREFEVKVIPRFFEHAKFSSFIRQANGWGFRRITQGRDRNSYYHPLFLRGLPHLCKQMKRPGVSEKTAADPDHEPDLYKISAQFPVPEKVDSDDAIMLQCTLEGGPKARMPIYSGALFKSSNGGSGMGAYESKPTPRDQHTIDAFQMSLGASENLFKNMMTGAAAAAGAATASTSSQGGGAGAATQPISLPATSLLTPTPFTMPNMVSQGGKDANPLAIANQLAFSQPNISAAMQASSAASQFAAGFAAATALSHQQFQAMLGSLAAGMGMPPTTAPTTNIPAPAPTTMGVSAPAPVQVPAPAPVYQQPAPAPQAPMYHQPQGHAPPPSPHGHQPMPAPQQQPHEYTIPEQQHQQEYHHYQYQEQHDPMEHDQEQQQHYHDQHQEHYDQEQQQHHYEGSYHQ
jgi:hypothetical protein